LAWKCLGSVCACSAVVIVYHTNDLFSSASPGRKANAACHGEKMLMTPTTQKNEAEASKDFHAAVIFPPLTSEA